MSEDQITDLLIFLYSKKIGEMQFNKSLSEVNNAKNSDAELEEHIYQCFKTRYGVSEKTMKLFE